MSRFKQTPPDIRYKEELKRLQWYYKRAFEKTLLLIASMDSSSRSDRIMKPQLEAELRQMQVIMNELNNDLGKWTEDVLTKAYHDGLVSAAVTMGIAKDIVEAREMIAFSGIKTHQMKAIIDDTFDDLLAANQNMHKRAKQLIREIVSHHMRDEIMQQRGYESARKTVLKEIAGSQKLQDLLSDRVFVGIVDRAGRKWDMQVYVDTVVRTKFTHTQIQASSDLVTEHYDGEQITDLAMISSHGAKDSCRHFEGVIVSLNGWTKGYPTLSYVRSSGLIFHPRCMHIVMPIGNIGTLSSKEIDRHRDKSLDADSAMVDPQATKRADQRQLYQDSKK